MSYDLYLKRRPGADVTAASLEAYFRKRRNYLVENGQALCENEQTGVYFIWDIDVEEEEEDLKGTGSPGATPAGDSGRSPRCYRPSATEALWGRAETCV